jgi:hypothetical protein
MVTSDGQPTNHTCLDWFTSMSKKLALKCFKTIIELWLFNAKSAIFQQYHGENNLHSMR